MEEINIIQTEEDRGITKRGTLNLVFSVCCLVIAYLFVGSINSIIPGRCVPLGYLILSVSLYALTAVIACINGGRIRIDSVIAFCFGSIVASYRFIHGDVSNDLFPVFLMSLLSYGYFTLSLYGNSSRSVTGRLLLDCVKVVASLFISFSSLFVSIFKPEGRKKSPKNTLLVIVGLIIAIILVVIVASLLSYDSHFTELLPKLDADMVFDVLAKVFFTIPIAAMMFSIFASSERHKLNGLSSVNSVEKISAGMKKIPPALVAIPVFSVLVIYVLFFVSQWAYYMSAFTHTLPDGYSAAEYAREGFFRLCVVVSINSALIIVIGCFMKIVGKAGETLQKIMKLLLSVASLILIATAVSKMLLYIDLYDLTVDRLVVTVFLVFLAISFIAVIISCLFRRVRSLPIIIVSALVMIAAFTLINTNGLIAKYNVDMYISGKHQNIDVEYLAKELSYSAVPELGRLYENAQDETVKLRAKKCLEENFADKDFEWYELSMPIINSKMGG